jgi:hypothetical protein
LTLAQDREAFDAGLRIALDEVRASLDLARLNDFVHTWWLIACDSVRDSQGRQEMYARAADFEARVERGESLPQGSRSWREILAARGSAG